MFGTVTQKAKNLHGWIDLIVTGGYPFRMVDTPVVRKYIKLEPIELQIFEFIDSSDSEIAELLPTATDSITIRTVMSRLKEFESIKKITRRYV